MDRKPEKELRLQNGSCLIVAGVSAVASLASLAWAVAAYTRAMRLARPDKTRVSWPGLVCQATWRGGMVTARIATLVLFAVGFHAWLFLFIGVHWLGMTIWIVFQKTDFCQTPWEECIYNCVVGVIYCFCFFNLQEGQSRHRALAFYVIIISQNLGCLGLFLALAGVSKSGVVEVAGAIIVGGTILGVCSMLLYYRFFHPAGHIRLCSKQLQHSMECGTPPCLTDLNAEQTATLRSLKHCWHVDRDGTLSRLGGTSSQEGSPHSDDVCTDKNLLLTHWVSGQTASPSVETGEQLERAAEEHEDKPATNENTNREKRRGICSPLELGLEEQDEEGTETDDIRKHKRRGICSLEPEMEVELELSVHVEGEPSDEEERRQKRRGICSPDILSLELSKEEAEDTCVDHSDDTLKNKRRGICSPIAFTSSLGVEEPQADPESRIKQPDVEGDETPSEVLSVPSEVLSAHDYENICAVNIARETWGLRSWRGYSDIETWLHDDSVVRDRRRDTLTSTTTTFTSASSEHSGGNGDSNTASPPPIPCRRPAPVPRALRTRQDDYLDTLIDDLADCETNVSDQDRPLAEFVVEEHDTNVFVARPYVVDQHGAFFPLVTLDTIMEELEESSTSTETGEPLRSKQRHGSASTLVATINEIRHGGSICNLYNSTDALWEIQSNSSVSIQQGEQNSSFCNSIPDSLLTSSHSRAHLSPEEVLFLSKLQALPDTKLESSPSSKSGSSPISSPEVILDASPYLETVRNLSPTANMTPSITDSRPGRKRAANRPRRKFSLLREKFESKQAVSNIELDTKKSRERQSKTIQSCTDCSETAFSDSKLNIICEPVTSEREPIVCYNKENITSVVPSRIKQWNNFLKTQNSCNARLSPEACKVINLQSNLDAVKPSLRERRSMFLRQVLSPSWGKKSSLSPASKVVPAS
ncbi:hypothetical protein ANN_10179 [Periplaneta americana]|uniref:XK-related protein n=1 Tax=Periplaneta americana TaxID=6978 RepID=A0ABQ8TNB9_PERAM|nr:hypothetical protein ANN_10179 [Periplaneta americana]